MPLRIKVADQKTPTGRKRPQAKSAGTSKRRIDRGADLIATKGRRATPTPKSQRKAPARTVAKSGTGSFRKSGQAVMAAKGRTSPLGGRPSTKTAATYKVKSGDTLSEIAKKRGTTIKKMMAANPSIKNANQIKTGQTLKVPAATKKASSPYTGLTAGQIKTGARTARGGGMMIMKKTKGMSKGGKMPMAKDPDTGKMVPAFTIDGKGKMMAGGMMKKTKGMSKGGKFPTSRVSKQREERVTKMSPAAKAMTKEKISKKASGMTPDERKKYARELAKRGVKPATMGTKKTGGVMKKAKGMAVGGATKRTKGMAVGGAMKKTKGMARGGAIDLNKKSFTRAEVRQRIKDLDKMLDDMVAGKDTSRKSKSVKKAQGGMMKKTKGMAKGGAMKKTKGMARGGMMKKTKGMARGGMMKGTKGYSRGGVARGMGAATKGGKFTRGG